MKMIFRLLRSLMLALLTLPMIAGAVDIRLSGFGDVVYGVVSGDPADAFEAAMFNEFGTGDFPPSTQESFTITGVDLVAIADLTEDVTFMAEINFQAARQASSEIEVDVERIFVNYDIDPKFNLQAGLFFTPIGYHNRFLYSRAWLMNSIQVHDLFEEELNFMPTHSIGVNANGTFHFDNSHALRYAFGIANGRPPAPDLAIYRYDSGGTEITWLAEWVVPMFNESRIGFSGWFDEIDTTYVENFGDVVDSTDPLAERLNMDEVGFDFYVTIRSHNWDLLFEYVMSTREDTNGNLPQDEYEMKGWTFEIAGRFQGGKLHPYIRYDVVELENPGGDPYLSLRADETEYTSVFITETEAAIIGVAYDLNTHTRIKAEFVKNLEGARSENTFALQFAFGF